MANGSRNDQEEGAPADGPMVALRRIITRILPRDSASSIWKFMGGMRRICAAIVVSLVPISLVYLFLDTPSENVQRPAIRVLSRLERLPTESAFYYSIATVAGAYLVWLWWVYTKHREGFERAKKENEDKRSLTPRDWWVVQGLRERAIAFRTLAGILLGGVVALLFGVVYFIVFVIPQVLESDRSLAKEIQRAEVKRQFGRRLQLIGEGRYWFEVADVDLGDTPISEDLKTTDTQLVGITLPAGMTLPRLPVLNTHETSRKELAIFAIGHSKALVALDGGQTWSVPMGLELAANEWIIAAMFGPDGQHGVVGSGEGSVFVTQDGGQAWSVPMGLELAANEWIIAAMFGPDGQHGVVGGGLGSVFVTQDGGRTWSVPMGLELAADEWIVAAMFGPDGQHGVVGGGLGSVFVTQDGGQTWSVPTGLELAASEWIVAAVFGANSQYGAVSNNKGKIFVTLDGGQTWSVLEDFMLKETEWIIAALNADGRFGVVGDEGSVFVTQEGGETWSVPKDFLITYKAQLPIGGSRRPESVGASRLFRLAGRSFRALGGRSKSAAPRVWDQG